MCVSPRAGHPQTHPLETAGAGLLPRACVVTVPILLGHTLRGDGGDPLPPPQKPDTPPMGKLRQGLGKGWVRDTGSLGQPGARAVGTGVWSPSWTPG